MLQRCQRSVLCKVRAKTRLRLLHLCTWTTQQKHTRKSQHKHVGVHFSVQAQIMFSITAHQLQVTGAYLSWRVRVPIPSAIAQTHSNNTDSSHSAKVIWYKYESFAFAYSWHFLPHSNKSKVLTEAAMYVVAACNAVALRGWLSYGNMQITKTR